MPKHVMKYRGADTWPSPKRGKARAHVKRPAAKTTAKKFKPVPYVRHAGVQKKFHKERMHFGVSIPSLLSMRSEALFRKLRADGILPKWEGQTCPHCGIGKLGGLHFVKGRRSWAHKCTVQGCRKYVQPHDFHPIFFSGSGQSHTPLKNQAAVLCCALAGVPVTSVPIILEMNHKPVERIFKNLEIARDQHVRKKEKAIKLGSNQKWADVRADEVDVGKEVEMDQKRARWEQWGGLLERGRPDTLVLFRLSPKTTASRSPGPGPITKRDWKPVAKKFLEGRDVILHTDGAKAYTMKIKGVFHDNVVHKKKKMTVNGKQVWVNPKYTKVWTHQLPNGKALKVKAGTQIIDRFWGNLRAYLKYAPRKVGSITLARKVRAAQWTYWHRIQNMWSATGHMLKELRA